MSQPIEPTPILKGEDAKRLLKSIIDSVYDQKKDAFLKSCDETYCMLNDRFK